jgi:exodeoxyribonuclease VII large subunit
MSNDQLILFKNLAGGSTEIGAEKPAEKSAASSTKSSPENLAKLSAESPEKKAAKKSRTKKPTGKSQLKPETKTASNTAAGLQDLYSKKDWSPLQSTKSETANSEPQALLQTKVSQEARPEKKSVRIPVVRSATELPYVDSTDQADEALPVRSSSATNARLPEPKVMSVSDLNKHIRDILEGRFPLLWLKAEISNFKAHTSGHFYFSLKDSKAQISAVMFRGFNSNLRFKPEDGMEVLVRGKITVYEPRGNYQIFCEMMEPVGAGALQKAFEQLKAKLQKEGLFDQSRKRPLPLHPKHIAIVTSPTGAAIRDMLNVLGRRFRGVHITVIPCKVQGDAAPGEIVEAMKLAQQLKDVDVMIVGRGGGSIEDLWAFNDERVVRAIAAARVPVVSAVGHEVDFTIADFVADLRAPTPSAAAELVVQNSADLMSRILVLTRSLKLALVQRIEGAREQLSFYSHRLVDPKRLLQDGSIRCDELLQRLEMSVMRSLETRESEVKLLRTRLGTPQSRIDREREGQKAFTFRLRSGLKALMTARKQSLTKSMAVLDSLSPLKVLDRGFSMVMVGERIVTNAKDLKPGDDVTVRMCEGSVEAQIIKVNNDER